MITKFNLLSSPCLSTHSNWSLNTFTKNNEPIFLDYTKEQPYTIVQEIASFHLIAFFKGLLWNKRMQTIMNNMESLVFPPDIFVILGWFTREMWRTLVCFKVWLRYWEEWVRDRIFIVRGLITSMATFVDIFLELCQFTNNLLSGQAFESITVKVHGFN